MGVPLWPKKGTKVNSYDIYGSLNSKSTEIDLRNELKLILDGSASSPQRGHWILLRRMDRTQKCSCWNEVAIGDDQYLDDNRKYNEPKEDCTICDGSGYVYQNELHITRRRIISPVIGLAAQEQHTPFGIINISYVVYYFKYHVAPKKEDKIIEITNDDEGKPVRPFNYEEIYNISVSEPLRDLNGRVEYWRVAVKMEGI